VVRRLVAVCALACALVLPALAQVPEGGEGTPPPPAGGEKEGGRRRRGPPREFRKLDFDAPPADWKARPADAQPGRNAMRFQGDWDLPPADGQTEGPRVTVLGTGAQQREFAAYQERLRGTWTKADGAPLAAADQTTETRKEGELEVRLVIQEGTQTPRGGSAKPGMKLVAAWVRAGKDSWSVWLLGTAEGVEKHKAAFLTWLDTARPGAVPTPPPAPAQPEGGEKPPEGGEKPPEGDGPH
jgi:hypothetical protein